MILKDIIHFADTNAVEVTWVRVIEPAKTIPAETIPESIDPVTGAAIPEQIIPEQHIPAVEQVVKCHTYMDVQMDDLIADLGEEAPKYADLIAKVKAGIKPPPPKTPEQIMADAKTQRAEAVDRIVVTTPSGKAFDGHEDAQNRMARAAVAMTDTDTTEWVLADNSIATVTKLELVEAMRLAGIETTRLWLAPYQ